MKTFSVTLAAIALGMGATAARADMIGDCNQSRDSQMRIYACTEIVDGTAYSDEQKATAYRNRAQSRADAGAAEQAIADFSNAIRLRPKNALALAGRAHALVNRDDIEGALGDFTAAIEINPKSHTNFIGRGYAYLLKGIPDAAIEDFNRAIALNPKSSSALNHRGLAYRKKGDAARAIEDYSAAVALNPAYALAYNNRGYVYEANGDMAKAAADFNQALWFDPSLTGAAEGLKRLGVPRSLAEDSATLIRQGLALVSENCSRCHAVGATGNSPNMKAPPFRTLRDRHPRLALREPLSRGIAAPHDEMPKFSPSEAEIDKIIAYINSLETPPGQ